MKKIFIIITLLSTAMFAQTPNWTTVKETNISVANASEFSDGVDIFTNQNGNHIIVQEFSYLKYYKMNTDGIADPPITIENSSTVSPSICGDANKICIVYALGNQIRIKRSTDGINWTQQTLTFDNIVDTVESTFSNATLHITYKKSNQIWYRYNKVGIIWTNPQLVSEGENGEYPRITARYGGANNDYVYFFWRRQGTNIGNWRRHEVTSNVWGAKNFGYEVFFPNLVSSRPAGFNVTNSTIIFYFYYKLYDAGDVPYFSWWYRDLYNNNPLGGYVQDYIWHDNKIYSTTTSDNKSHVVYYLRDGGTNVFDIWRSNSEDGFWDDIVYDYSVPPYWGYGPRYLNISSAGNEVHVIWKDAYGNNGGNNLRYKYDDQIPLAPIGLTVTEDANHHPKLTWNASPEPDRHHYIIYRYDTYGGGWQYLNQTPNGTTYTYTDETLTYCHAIPPNQCPDVRTFYYHITVVDNGSHESAPSNQVEARLRGGPPSKIVVNPNSNEPIEYSLGQNYPNPFNPTTTINYSIQKAGEVTLKVYDMLGTEVASIVKEMKEAGNYSVTYNASDLPSGIYVYRLNSGNFVNTKKLILLK